MTEAVLPAGVSPSDVRGRVHARAADAARPARRLCCDRACREHSGAGDRPPAGGANGGAAQGVFDLRAGVTRAASSSHGSGASGRPPRCSPAAPWSTPSTSSSSAGRRSRAVSAPTARSPRLTTPRPDRALDVKHLAELGLVVGLVPMSALIVLLWLAVRRAPTTVAERAFLAVVPAALLWVLVETGAFAATTTPALFERYTFYLEPLLLLAFVVWLTRGLPRPRIGTAVALGVPALLLLSLTLAQVVSPDAVNGVTLGALYRFSVHLPGGIHELKAAIAIGGRAGGLPVRDLREADRPDRAAAVAGGVLRRRGDLDHRQHSQRRGTRDCGHRPELGRACRRSRRAGRLREHAGARLGRLGAPVPDRVLEPERQARLQRRGERHLRAARDADDARHRERADRAARPGGRSLRARRSERPVRRDARRGRGIGRRSSWPSTASAAPCASAPRPKGCTATAGWEHRRSTRCSSRRAGGPDGWW